MNKQFSFSWSTPLISSMTNGDIGAPKLFDLAGQAEISQGLNCQGVFFRGFISNQPELQTKFEKLETSLDELLLLAIRNWGNEVNQYVLGDYILVWLDNMQLTITCSAHSSHSVFYSYFNNYLKVTSEMSQIAEVEAELNETLFLQRYSFGLLLNSETSYKDIQQLLPGETISWQKRAKIIRNHQQRLEPKLQKCLSKQVTLPAAIRLNKNNVVCKKSEQLFNLLPQLAFELTEPVLDASLVEFSDYLKKNKSSSVAENDFVLLDKHWLTGRYQVDIEFLDKNYRSYSVLTKKLLRQRHQLKKLKQKLFDEYSVSADELSNEINFSQWCDINYVLPAWYRLLQRIAQLHGKILINPYIDIDLAKSIVVNKEADSKKAYFSLPDVSIHNVFDAMQRLLYNGEQSTKKLFNMAPPATSKLVQRFTVAPRRTEQACIQMLTLDYLLRFRSIQII